MPQISVTVKGLNEFHKYMADRPDQFFAAIGRILKKAIFLVEGKAKFYAPVITGRLRASIGGGAFSEGAFPQGEGIIFADLWASIGPTVEYAPFVHRRTPFMSAGLYDALPEIQGVVDREVHAALTKK